MRRPQPTVPDVSREQSIIESVERSAGRKGRDARESGIDSTCHREGRCVNRNRNISGNARCTAGATDPAHDQSAKRCVARSNDVAFGRIRIVIINAPWTIRPVAAAD
jgi:hypothetical protein